MRYFLQFAAMFGDILLIVASAYTIWMDSRFLILVIPAFLVWKKQGGFIAWHPASIRQFMTNAKKIGL